MYRSIWCVTLCSLAGPLWAQDVRVEVAKQEPPYYVGEPVVIQFTAEGFDEQPEPTCALETASGQPVPGLRGQMGGVSPQVFSQIIQRNGQLYSSKTVTHQIRYLVTAERPGNYQVGPFVIKQGNKQARVEPVAMSFEDVPADPNMSVRLILPEGPVYPDQRVPVVIEWSYAESFENVLKLSIYSPLFDEFRFGPDEQPTRRSTELPIETRQGRLTLAASAHEEQRDGRQFVVVSARRTLIPDRVGEFALPPITATLRKATAWARARSPLEGFDDFGFGSSLFRDLLDDRRRPARTALGRAVGAPQTLVVKPFPLEGRPASFAGAVGSGFSIDVSADRTVVRVGDPIALDITLQGEGNIDNASLPPLSADGGMNPQLFRLPDGDVPGTLADSAKHFRVSVRVADESVAEIPALAYSWFDPTSETYQTSRSKPIALRVMPAQVVSAADVVRGGHPTGTAADDVTTANGTSSVGPDQTSPSSSAASRSSFSLSGADLAVEPEAGIVLRDDRATFGNTRVVPAVIYAAGCLLILVAVVDRKRRNVDPVLVARRKTLRQQQARIARAAGLAQAEAAAEIAAALRVLIAEVPDVRRDAAQAVVAECESIVYAPNSSSDSRLDDALVERAKRAAEV